MDKHPFPRIDKDEELQHLLIPFCRMSKGDTWIDDQNGHKVACGSSDDSQTVSSLFGAEKATLAIHDPPYNFIAFQNMTADEYAEWCKVWIDLTDKVFADDASLYVWLGADQTNHFEPLPNFMLMMQKTGFDSRSYITMRNQRGYGTQKNWMSIRQELLFYSKGSPLFNIESVYTEIPKVLRGYYKEVNGEVTENLARSKSDNIRAGNVWVDIQQVFHLRDENVNGCYAQKPVKSIERIVNVSSSKGDLVTDFFSHAGTTLLACEKNDRRCFTIDINPVYCEISIRRLERFRKSGNLGWQNSNPFIEEIKKNRKLKNYLNKKYKLNY